MVRHFLSWFLVLVWISSGSAQEPPPVDSAPAVKIGSDLERSAPYSGWKTHLGKVEDAIALFEVTRPDELVARYATGLVIRCDGFFLAPTTVADSLDHRAVVRVRISGAENEKLSDSLRVEGRPASRSRRSSTCPVKLNGHHLKCVRLLDSSNLVGGQKVRLLSAIPIGGRFKIQEKTALVGRKSEKDRWSLENFSEKLSSGTVVVDEASGAPIGMVPSGADPGEFASFAFFADNCGEVALAPTPDAAKGRATDPDGMQLVPGGPTQLLGESAKTARQLYGTDIVCMPDFYCDKNPVTIGEYDAWYRKKRALPLPTPWRDAPKAFPPTRLSGWPVSGVRPDEVRLYARDHGKRLLTEAEWMRASYQPDTAGLSELGDAYDRAVTRMENADRSLRTGIFRRKQVEITRAEVIGRAQGKSLTPVSPIIDDLLDSWIDEITQTVAELRESLPEGEVRGPGFPFDVGRYSKDTSVWGIRGTATNLLEMLLDRGAGVKVTWKPVPSLQDPFVTIVQWTRAGIVGSVGSELGASSARNGLTTEILMDTQDPLYLRGLLDAMSGRPTTVTTTEATADGDGPKAVAMRIAMRSYVIRPVSYLAFRLAR